MCQAHQGRPPPDSKIRFQKSESRKWGKYWFWAHLRGLQGAGVQRRGDTGGAIAAQADLAPGPAPAPRAAGGPAWAA
jgi:hypothetical protein